MLVKMISGRLMMKMSKDKFRDVDIADEEFCMTVLVILRK
jgi:hypothetical protein